MKILVVTTDRDCPAVAFLQMEGLLGYTEVVIAKDEYTYGEAFYKFWIQRERFINLEHDIVPWPGAIEQLWGCTQTLHLCTFGYQGAPEGSLGLTRFTTQIINAFPWVCHYWPKTKWNQMDGAVGDQLLPNMSKHQHYPTVAHLTHLKRLYPHPHWNGTDSRYPVVALAQDYSRDPHDVRNALHEVKIYIDDYDMVSVREVMGEELKLRRLLWH